jgi:hypothetical protein
MMLFWLLILITIGIALFFLWKQNNIKRLKQPDEVLKDVETYISNAQVPDYVAIQTLQQALKYNPDNIDLKSKLHELEKST